MTSDYFLKKWRKTIADLNSLIDLDLEYQNSKVTDKDWCDAIERLNSILARYIFCYNNAIDCYKQNLQVQKTDYLKNIINAIVPRIMELKSELKKLGGGQYQYLSNGIISQKLTTDDVEITDELEKCNRSEVVNNAIEEAFQKVKQLREESDKVEGEVCEESSETKTQWWNEEINSDPGPRRIDIAEVYAVKEKLSEETLERRKHIALIQAHEKSRQITLFNNKQKLKREMWEKELKGTLNPPAPAELREKSAKLIQKIIRKRIQDCQRDELLNLRLCNKPVFKEIAKDELMFKERSKKYHMFEEQWRVQCDTYKQKFLREMGPNIADDMRDYVREWFRVWFTEVQFIQEIPKQNVGGISLILNEEILSPLEWQEEYKKYIESKETKKGKTVHQLKWEKQEAKKEEMRLKKETMQQLKLQADLMRNIKKNPSMHPGYRYPKSNKIEHLRQEIEIYNIAWLDLDDQQVRGVKERNVKDLDISNACKEVKKDMSNAIDGDMRAEFKLLDKALKADYKRLEEKMPERIKRKIGQKQKSKKIKPVTIDDNLVDKLTFLLSNGFLKEFPSKRLKNFLGDANYAGSELRCLLRTTLPFGAETRALWWEKCYEMAHGLKRILLIGPPSTGKTTLVHILASLNDAVLYELDSAQIDDEKLSPIYLDILINELSACAKATQPSVIYVKHVHQFFFTKTRPNMDKQRMELIKVYFIRKLFKKFKKGEKITIIGTCHNPWQTRSEQMLRKFPGVVLMPNTSYTMTSFVLRNWVLDNRIVPWDFNIQSLAYVLQGYPYGYLVKILNSFLTPDRIIRIAAYGLSPSEVYNYILEDGSTENTNFQKYLAWYFGKTASGKLEQKKNNEQKEFRLLLENWKQKVMKRKNIPGLK